MKVSAKARYGLRILLDVAINETPERPRTIKEIAESQAISEKFISRIVVPLREQGMIQSERGKFGGFRLARAPRDITLLAVIEALQGAVSVVDCVLGKKSCQRVSTCIAHSFWEDVNGSVQEALRNITLENMLERLQRNTSLVSALSACAIK